MLQLVINFTEGVGIRYKSNPSVLARLNQGEGSSELL